MPQSSLALAIGIKPGVVAYCIKGNAPRKLNATTCALLTQADAASIPMMLLLNPTLPTPGLASVKQGERTLSPL